jgi:hypothetical protein
LKNVALVFFAPRKKNVFHHHQFIVKRCLETNQIVTAISEINAF